MSIFSFIVCLISQGSRNLFLLAGKQPPADKCQSYNCFLWNTLICIVLNFLWSASSPYHPQYSYHFIKWISAHFPHWTNQRSPWVYGLETNGTEWNSQWLKLWKKKKSQELSEAMISAMRTELTQQRLTPLTISASLELALFDCRTPN